MQQTLPGKLSYPDYKRIRQRVLGEFGSKAEVAFHALVREFPGAKSIDAEFMSRRDALAAEYVDKLYAIIDEEAGVTDDMDYLEAIDRRESMCEMIVNGLAREKKSLRLSNQVLPAGLKIFGLNEETTGESGTSTTNPKLQPPTAGGQETSTP